MKYYPVLLLLLLLGGCARQPIPAPEKTSEPPLTSVTALPPPITCVDRYISDGTAIAFSYDTDCQIWKDGDPGVKTKGFVNTEPRSVTTAEQALERAKADCTVSCDSAEVFRDEHTPMWKVWFYTRSGPGGDQSVYLDDEGITKRRVSGE